MKQVCLFSKQYSVRCTSIVISVAEIADVQLVQDDIMMMSSRRHDYDDD